TSFFIAFVFLSSEKEEDYSWALQELWGVIQKEDIQYPGVIVTDRELALMNALQMVFPQCQTLLCEWHIAKVVLTYIKQERVFRKRITDVDNTIAIEIERTDQNSFMSRFASLIGSTTTESYSARVNGINKDYNAYPQLLRYLSHTWLDPYASKFIRAFADRHLHFGNRATSRIEGGHATLKKYLQTST